MPKNLSTEQQQPPIATPEQTQEAKPARRDTREPPAANHHQTGLGPDHRNDWTRQKYKWVSRDIPRTC